MTEMNQIVPIMDVNFLNITQRDFLEGRLFPKLINHEKCFVVTANPELVMKTREDSAYKQSINKADYIVPDGVGIILAAAYKGRPLHERVTGSDITFDLLAFAEVKGLSCYFLGASENVNKKVVEEVESMYPRLKVAGRKHGFFDLDDPAVVDDVKIANPDIVFVALGLPRQENWIAKHIDRFNKGLFIGVGGTFDVIAGEVNRAPKFWIKLNLEWLYRLIKQPFRFKRILKVFEFMIRVVLKRD